jgi:hypothetical protein
MIVYTVHEPASPASRLEKRAEQIVFIKEGFTWLGFFFPPLWLLFNRLWLEFAASLVLTSLLALGLMQWGLAEQGSTIANLLLALLVGFEGNDLRRWRLARKGYVYLASVAGRNFDECEQRFFLAWLPQASGETAPPSSIAHSDKKGPPPAAGMWGRPAVIGTFASSS